MNKPPPPAPPGSEPPPRSEPTKTVQFGPTRVAPGSRLKKDRK